GVVVRELRHGRDWRGLVQLHSRFLGDLLRHELGNTLDCGLNPLHRISPGGARLGHLLDVAVGAVAEDGDFRHRLTAPLACPEDLTEGSKRLRRQLLGLSQHPLVAYAPGAYRSHAIQARWPLPPLAATPG